MYNVAFSAEKLKISIANTLKKENFSLPPVVTPRGDNWRDVVVDISAMYLAGYPYYVFQGWRKHVSSLRNLIENYIV